MRLVTWTLLAGLLGVGGCSREPEKTDATPWVKPPPSEAERRQAEKVSGYKPGEADEKRVGQVELAGSHDSLDALGKAVVAGLVAKDAKALQQQLISKEEFYAMFGALTNDPQGRGASVQIAWMNQSANSRGSLTKVLGEWGGKELTFARLEVAETRDRVGLVEHRNPKLVVTDASGKEITITALGPVLEQKSSGKFKLLSFRDRD